MKRLLKPAGFTLIELTVVLSVLVILTLVLAPTIMGWMVEARIHAAKKETTVIGEAIARFYQDTGFFPKTADSVAGRIGQFEVDLLVSKGSIPLAPTGPVRDSNGRIVNVDVSGWINGSADLLDNHLQKNIPGYRMKGGPNQYGWAGPYLNAPEINADPWGNRYMVNIRFLDPSPGALDARGQVKNSVWVLSAGPNGIIETPFAQPVTLGGLTCGDDVSAIIQ